MNEDIQLHYARVIKIRSCDPPPTPPCRLDSHLEHLCSLQPSPPGCFTKKLSEARGNGLPAALGFVTEEVAVDGESSAQGYTALMAAAQGPLRYTLIWLVVRYLLLVVWLIRVSGPKQRSVKI